MHGVAGRLMLRALRLAGFAAPHLVAAQAEPDPDFPTVAFPNPEEPGALDLALADARRLGADLVVASDPDGDRLAVAVPDPAAGWRVLTGDQLGALLGASLLERTAGQEAPEARLVASTVVSSTLLAKIAAAAGVRYAETLTGFKWIARAADGVPGAGSSSATRRRSATPSATWCATRTASAPRWPCSGWPKGRSRQAVRSSMSMTTWSGRTACT